MEDASLDDFLDDSEDSDTTESEGSDTVDSEAVVPGDADEAVAEAAPSTSRWRPEGGACAVCADTAARLWHDDGQFVCASCKDWE